MNAEPAGHDLQDFYNLMKAANVTTKKSRLIHFTFDRRVTYWTVEQHKQEDLPAIHGEGLSKI